MKWPVKVDPTATFGERIVQVAASALAAGTLGQTHRADVYAAFVACGQAQDLSHVKTSCGIFARACMHWAGRPVPGPGVPGWPLVGGLGSWLRLQETGAYWRPAALAKSHAVPGCVFIKSAPDHVGILIAELVPGVWVTAEGGGGDGTDCKITWRCLDETFPHLVGLWLPDLIDGVGDPPAAPAGAPAATPPALPIVYHDPRKDAAAAWQRRLMAWRPGCLPKYGADGGYGDETATATLAVQAQAGLPLDGHKVDGATWLAAK